MTDYDPRLVSLYDVDNPDGPDHDFYRALADKVRARSILDLGCGTGILTVTLAQPGRTVIGVDPSVSMLAFAKQRPAAGRVTWIVGDSATIPAGAIDVALMTGNVAQHIPDAAWMRTLRDVRQAMREGGTLAFESRNPAVREWERWDSGGEHTTRSTQHGPLEEWMELEASDGRTVTFAAHNVFADSGDHVVEQLTLLFRSRAEIERDLQEAGFTVDAVYGDWAETPFGESARLMVFVARATH